MAAALESSALNFPYRPFVWIRDKPKPRKRKFNAVRKAGRPGTDDWLCNTDALINRPSNPASHLNRYSQSTRAPKIATTAAQARATHRAICLVGLPPNSHSAKPESIKASAEFGSNSVVG